MRLIAGVNILLQPRELKNLTFDVKTRILRHRFLDSPFLGVRGIPQIPRDRFTRLHGIIVICILLI